MKNRGKDREFPILNNTPNRVFIFYLSNGIFDLFSGNIILQKTKARRNPRAFSRYFI